MNHWVYGIDFSLIISWVATSCTRLGQSWKLIRWLFGIIWMGLYASSHQHQSEADLTPKRPHRVATVPFLGALHSGVQDCATYNERCGNPWTSKQQCQKVPCHRWGDLIHGSKGESFNPESEGGRFRNRDNNAPFCNQDRLWTVDGHAYTIGLFLKKEEYLRIFLPWFQTIIFCAVRASNTYTWFLMNDNPSPPR